jgi:hypothetical protein
MNETQSIYNDDDVLSNEYIDITKVFFVHTSPVRYLLWCPISYFQEFLLALCRALLPRNTSRCFFRYSSVKRTRFSSHQV